MRRTGNPALSAKTFDAFPVAADRTERMTVQGTVNRSFVLLTVLLATATWPWQQLSAGNVQGAVAAGGIGLVGGLICALVIVLRKTTAPVLAVPYAALEGLVLGAMSAWFETRYPGIALQAVALTFGIFAALLLAYTSRLIKVTENFRLGVVAATGGVFLLYMASFVLGFFGVHLSFLHDSSPLGIAISIGIVIIASLNLVLDFDFIEAGAERGAPKFMEWYGAFGLLVTLVWLYLEVLRLLARSRD